jgi:hypothetical protein
VHICLCLWLFVTCKVGTNSTELSVYLSGCLAACVCVGMCACAILLYYLYDCDVDTRCWRVRSSSVRRAFDSRSVRKQTPHTLTHRHTYTHAPFFIFRCHLLMESVDWPTEARSGRVYRKLKPKHGVGCCSQVPMSARTNSSRCVRSFVQWCMVASHCLSSIESFYCSSSCALQYCSKHYLASSLSLQLQWSAHALLACK